MSNPRLRRWEWWAACTELAVFKREMYAFTEYEGMTTGRGNKIPNAVAGGQPGQEVLKTHLGALMWVPNDKRIIVAPNCAELERRVRRVFPAWRVESDMPTQYHGRKVPKQIASLLASGSTTTFFRK